MISSNNSTLSISAAFVEGFPFVWNDAYERMDATSTEGPQDPSEFVAALAVLLANSTKYGAIYPKTVQLGPVRVTITHPLNTQTVFMRPTAELRSVYSRPFTQARAPSWKESIAQLAECHQGVFVADPFCDLLGVELGLVAAQRSSGTGPLRTARIDEIIRVRAQLLEAYVKSPFAATKVVQASATEIVVTRPATALNFGFTSRPLSQEVMRAAQDFVFYPQWSNNPDQVRQAYYDAVHSNLTMVGMSAIDITRVTRPSLDGLQTAWFNDNVGSFFAQPTVVLDAVGEGIGELDPQVFLDIQYDLIKKSTTFVGVRPFVKVDAPRNLTELLLSAGVVVSDRLASSFEAFYKRSLRPMITPAPGGSPVSALYSVHPALSSLPLSWDASGRVATTNSNGTVFTCTYPDWLGKDLDWGGETSEDVKSFIEDYLSVMDLIAWNIGCPKGQPSAERLRVLGVLGVLSYYAFGVPA